MTNVEEALAKDRVIDITTTGRKSGDPRRIEIWYHRLDGRYYITGTPDRPRAWYANLVANPAFTFHLRDSATADLSATARPITEASERADVLGGILQTLGEVGAASPLDEWLENSPLVEVTFAS